MCVMEVVGLELVGICIDKLGNEGGLLWVCMDL